MREMLIMSTVPSSISTSKFRAWVLGKMYEVKNLEWDWGHLIITTDGGWIALPDPEAHLMEFTGLRDKNGVEIYEGDVVKSYPQIDPNYHEVGVVEFDVGGCCYILKNRKSNCGDYREYIEWPSEHFDVCEVIGNIHENPELVESPDA